MLQKADSWEEEEEKQLTQGLGIWQTLGGDPVQTLLQWFMQLSYVWPYVSECQLLIFYLKEVSDQDNVIFPLFWDYSAILTLKKRRQQTDLLGRKSSMCEDEIWWGKS